MRGPVLQVEGARELRRTLKRAGDDVGELKEAHADVARIVEPVARAGAPRVSGRLAASVRSTGTASASIVRAGYASVPYAGPIHWGWPARNIKPQPFVAEAAESTQPRWMETFRRHIDRILSKIKGA